MKIKKHTLFLLISLAILSVAAIFVIVDICQAQAEVDSLLATNSDTQYRVGLELSLFFGAFFVAVAFGIALSFIRSVYKILKYKPQGWIKVCYIISASLAFLSIVFFIFLMFDPLDFASRSGSEYISIEDLLLFGLCPASPLSFILGSLPVRGFREIYEELFK